MIDLELTRSEDDRRLYSLAGVGALRVRGILSRSATAEAGGATWRLRSSGLWRRRVQAVDAAGAVAGEFDGRGGMRRGGAIRWGGREYALRPASSWRERYALVDGDRELAVIEGKGWGRRPVAVSVEDSVEPGLLLFAVFVVRTLANDAAATTSAVSTSVT